MNIPNDPPIQIQDTATDGIIMKVRCIIILKTLQKHTLEQT